MYYLVLFLLLHFHQYEGWLMFQHLLVMNLLHQNQVRLQREHPCC